jgi:thioredoxin
VPNLTRTPPGKDEWPNHITSLNEKKFDKFIDKYPLTLVDFWASWCQPCKTLSPRLRQLAKQNKGKVAFAKVNVDSERNLAKRFHVMGIPKVIFFSYGEKISSITGVRPMDEYQKKIDEILVKFETKH